MFVSAFLHASFGSSAFQHVISSASCAGVSLLNTCGNNNPDFHPLCIINPVSPGLNASILVVGSLLITFFGVLNTETSMVMSLSSSSSREGNRGSFFAAARAASCTVSLRLFFVVMNPMHPRSSLFLLRVTKHPWCSSNPSGNVTFSFENNA